MLALVKKMMLSISWHAANVRKGYEKPAETDMEEFKATKMLLKELAIQNQGTLELDVIELMASLATSAAWYAANKWKGYSKDAKLDVMEMVRTLNCLYVRRRQKVHKYAHMASFK
jgi:hypothetical protein